MPRRSRWAAWATLDAAIRPYDLRHSFVSLLIAERRSIVDVARQAGHSPSMALNTYGHLFDELEDGESASAEELIRAARALVRPPRQNVGSQANENSA
jgi:integrase